MSQSFSDDPGAARLLSAGSASVFIAVLAFSLFVGLFIQLILLPFILPSLHAGHGLLRGADWVGFHADAVKLAHKIANAGWGNFELRPEGQAPVGITAAIYAIIGIYEPWILVPIHAVMFALGATGLFNIYTRVVDARFAILGLVPLVLFPSSVLLYAQIHKDVWSITGSIWISFVLVAYISARKISSLQHCCLLVITVLAMASVWLVRAYLLQLLLIGIFLAIGFVLVWTAVTTRFRPFRQELLRWSGMIVCLLVLFAAALDWPTKIIRKFEPELASRIAAPNLLEGQRAVSTPTIVPSELAKTFTPAQQEMLAKNRLDELKQSLNVAQLAWWQEGEALVRAVVEALTPQKTEYWWIPPGMQERIDAVIHIRRGYMLSGMAAGSAIDHEAPIRNPEEILRYLPRALQIGLLSPFPNLWFRSGVSPGAGAMRAVAGIETMLSYVLLLGFLPLLFLASPEQWKRIIFVALLVLPIICIFAITIPNVGTLYRTRFGYLHILLGFGVIGWSMLSAHLRELQPSAGIAVLDGEPRPPSR